MVLGWEIQETYVRGVEDSRTNSCGSGGEKRSQSPYIWERL